MVRNHACMYVQTVHPMVPVHKHAGLNTRRQVWWRRLVTQIQTSQFVLGAIMTLYGGFHFFKMPTIVISDSGLPWFSYSRGCDAESWAIYTCGAFNLAFLFLFMHWYVTTYNMPKKARATLSGHEKTC